MVGKETTMSPTKRPRDMQRERVYRAESAAFDKSESEGLSVQECQRLIDKMAASEWVRRRYPNTGRDVFVTDGRGRRRPGYRHGGRYYESQVLMPRWARSRWILCHEYAHHLTHHQGAAHGWEFAECYLYLVRVFIGRWAEDELKREFRSHRVRFAKPRTRRLTEAQRQAAAERLRAYRQQQLVA